jgi:hypothetical protein
MKSNGRIRELLGQSRFNDIEYGHRVIWPLLDYLSIPNHARRPQFQIENPFGIGLLRLDYLLHDGDVPLVTIEGEPMARQFDIGFRQAKNYSRNFKPRQRGCPMQERTVPFLITAAGNRAEMFRAVVRGLNIEYEPIREGGLPAFLEWSELLTFLYPQHSGRLQVYLHNALYQRAPRNSEIEEDVRAERHLRPGEYDVVIGNPPGNDEYSGTNRREIERQWEPRFGHVGGGLMDHHCFVRRAIDLARPDGGRICLVLPEGFLTRDNRGMPALREEVARECELRLVITLPRVFKENNARMAVVYMVRTPTPEVRREVLLAEIRETWRDAEGVEHTTDLFGELERIIGSGCE